MEERLFQGVAQDLRGELVKSNRNRFVPLGRACRQQRCGMDAGCCSWWHGRSAHWAGPVCEPSIGGDNPGQLWPLARSGQDRCVLRKLYSKWCQGKALELFEVFCSTATAVGVQPPTGVQQAPSAQPSTSKESLNPSQSSHMRRRRRLIPHLSCLAAITYWYFRWLKFWTGMCHPVWAYSIPAADMAGTGQTHVSKLCLQRGSHR